VRRRAPRGEPRWRSLVGASAAQAGLSYLEQGVPALVPYVKADLGLSSPAAGVFAVSVNAGRAVSSTGAGRLVARYGRRRMLLVGCIASGAAGVGAAVTAPGSLTLVLLVVAGVVQMAAIVAGITGIGRWFPRRSRGTALGLRQAAVSVGGLLAAVSLPALAIAYGWRASLALAGATTIVLGAAGAWLYREPSEAKEAGLPVSSSRPAKSAVRADRAIRRTIVVAMTLSASQYVVLAYVQVYFVEELHVGLGAAAAVLASVQVAAVAGRLGWGVVSDVAFGGRRTGVMAAMLGLAGAAAIGTAVVPADLALALGLPLAVVLGLTTVGSPGIYVALLADIAPAGAEETTMGTALSFVLGSAVVVPPLFGALADAVGYHLAWIALAATLLAQVPVVLSIERLVADR
jgi:sugar phosphate permease